MDVPVRDAAAVRATRDALLRFASDFHRVAARLDGPQLRAALGEWLAGATFDKATRVLAVSLYTVPVSLLAGGGEGVEVCPGTVGRGQPAAGKPRVRVFRVRIGRAGDRRVA